MPTRVLAILSTREREAPEGDKLAKRPRDHVLACCSSNSSASNYDRPNETDVSMDISERFSLWKEQAIFESVWQQKRPLREQISSKQGTKRKNITEIRLLKVKQIV